MMHARNRRAVARCAVGPTERTGRHLERASGPRNAKYGHLCQRATRLDVLLWRASLRDVPAAGVHGSFQTVNASRPPREQPPYWFESY